MLQKIRDGALVISGCGSLYLALVIGSPGITVEQVIRNSPNIGYEALGVLVATVTYLASEWVLKTDRQRQTRARKKAHLLGTDTPRSMACVKHIEKINTKVS